MPKGGHGAGGGSRGNKAPTDIDISNSTVLENTAGAEIGFLKGIDPNKRDLLTYAVDDSRFEIVLDSQGRSVLRLKADTALDFETTASLTVEITATDPGGLTKTVPFTITVYNKVDGTELVSASSTSTGANGHSLLPSISGEGRYVAFLSAASDLVGGDNNATYDVFVRDLLLGTTSRISVDSSGAEANAASYYAPAVSADGRYVAFGSHASNLVVDDTKGGW
jgi:hypothetical protein